MTASKEARLAGIPRTAIASIVASVGANRDRRHAAAGLLTSATTALDSPFPKPLKKKKVAKKTTKKQIVPDDDAEDEEGHDDRDDDDDDDEPEHDDKPDHDDDDDDDDEEDADEDVKKVKRKPATSEALSRRIAALEGVADRKRPRTHDTISDPLLRAQLKALGQPSTHSGVARANRVAVAKVKRAQGAVAPSMMPRPSLQSELDKAAFLAGFGSDAELRAAARKAEALLRKVRG